MENDPDRPTVKAECPCHHSTCGKVVERADPREALAKMKAAPQEASKREETGKKENESFWEKAKRYWAEAGKEYEEEKKQAKAKDSWVWEV